MTFEQALRMAGLRPREVVADGKIRRCDTESKPGKKNGWYMLRPDGTGVWGDWASGGSDVLGTWRDEHAHVDPAKAAQLAERAQRQRAQERADRIEAMRKARRFWEGSRPCSRLHPYLAAKSLSPLGTQALREHDGALVAPVMWSGRVISVQTIRPDGVKRFWPGAPVKGGSLLLDRPRAALTVICEGLATGLALFQCLRQARVLVAFDAGNLLPVIQAVKPSGSVVIAADNDAGTQARRGFNPGLDKARNAAELIGCGVAAPEGIEGTDWADALREWGPMGAKRIERLVQAGARYVAGVKA